MAEEDDFINRFSEELHHASDFITVALNAHLEIERSLDGYINRIFEHTMYLDEAQLTFYQKVCITRAYAPTSHDRYEWGMMIFINTMRNKIAHRSRHRKSSVQRQSIAKNDARDFRKSERRASQRE